MYFLTKNHLFEWLYFTETNSGARWITVSYNFFPETVEEPFVLIDGLTENGRARPQKQFIVLHEQILSIQPGRRSHINMKINFMPYQLFVKCLYKRVWHFLLLIEFFPCSAEFDDVGNDSVYDDDSDDYDDNEEDNNYNDDDNDYDNMIID